MKYYTYRLDAYGNTMNSHQGRVAEDQLEALKIFNDINKLKGWSYTAVLHAPVPEQKLQYNMDFDYWVFDRLSRPLPIGEGPVLLWMGESDENPS